MRKKTGGKDSTKQGKSRRRIGDLAPKKVKGGEATTIKGGATGHEKWIELNKI